MSLSTAHILPGANLLSDELKDFALERTEMVCNRSAQFRDAVDKQFGQYHLRPARQRINAYIWNGGGDSGIANRVDRLNDIRSVLQKPEPEVVTFWAGGNLATVKRQRTVASQVGGGLRGSVKEFSRQSARSLQRTIAKIRADNLSFFCTLTYADTYPNFGYPELYKNDLKRFAQKFELKW